jgi:hypothetical protein
MPAKVNIPVRKRHCRDRARLCWRGAWHNVPEGGEGLLGMRNWAVGVSFAAASVGFALSAPAAQAQARPGAEVSAQERTAARRPPVRIDIYGNRARAVRECAPVFEERWIPQWGGRVLYAGQSCRWVPARY